MFSILNKVQRFFSCRFAVVKIEFDLIVNERCSVQASTTRACLTENVASPAFG